jgi:hypothetical protein
LGLRRGQLLLQFGDASIAFPASGAEGWSYRGFTDSRGGHDRRPSKGRVSGKPGNPAGTMAAAKEAELIEVNHSVSIPIIRDVE